MSAKRAAWRRLAWYAIDAAGWSAVAAVAATHPATVSPGEVAWTGLAISGLRWTVQNLFDAHGDLAFQRERRGAAGYVSRELIARGTVRRERLRIVAILAALLLGWLALFAPPRALLARAAAGAAGGVPLPGPAWLPAVQDVLAPVCLIVILGCGVLLNSYLDRRERLALLALLRQQQERDRRRGAEFHALRHKLADARQPGIVADAPPPDGDEAT